jgi:hypothetical protein
MDDCSCAVNFSLKLINMTAIMSCGHRPRCVMGVIRGLKTLLFFFPSIDFASKQTFTTAIQISIAAF